MRACVPANILQLFATSCFFSTIVPSQVSYGYQYYVTFILLDADELEDDAKQSGFVLYVGI